MHTGKLATHITIPTPKGIVHIRAVQVNDTALIVAMSPAIPEVPVVRFHSSCVFGEALHAVDCDCGAQATAALELIIREGGILVYAWEEGRGVGIVDKVRAIALQEQQKLSTAEAFAALGHQPDPRTFALQIEALKQVFGGNRIRLASNNPQKIRAIEAAGFTVVERVKLVVPMTPERKAYLEHKKEHLGHLYDD